MADKRPKNELFFLEDILECIDKILEYVEFISEVDFEGNSEKQDAVIRRIEIIGEAVKNISIETRSQYPDISWREIAGMRDMVIYEYFGITMGLVWKFTTSDIPTLKLQIEKIIEDKYPSIDNQL
ncbi:MAG: DUF86 domain-containing protein [Cyclobacteriaceae bacterium]|jgi:uncharacterized protein with HEPN domain|nr:DUF86 domain-containing protein [Cyclobacteriaceae bacterium]